MKKMMYDSVRLALVLVAMTAGLASCGKDEVTGRVNLATDLLVIDEPGDTRTVNFTTSHVRSLSVSTTPEGWKAEADLAAGVLTVTAPARIDETVKRSGSVVLSGTTTDGGAVSASLAVGVYESVDLSAAPSNCYLLSKKDTYYRIDDLHRGETSETLPTASVKLIWQTAGKPLQYVALHDGKISFLVGANDDGELKEGNALLGAYDAAGELIWSWHVWVTAYDPEKDATVYGDYTVMNRNLGALNNANASAAEILSSYGMYYQWGRKEPFAGPSTYNAAQGTNAVLYDAAGSRLYLTETKSSAETGTAEYALRNPLCFILGTEESEFDWLYAAHDANRWSDRKTVNDPCPRGWKVPSADRFANLSIADKSGDADVLAERYGWELTDGTASSLWMGLGRRTYLTGRVQNIYDPLPVRNSAMEAQPWEGLYWTTGTQADKASAFYFFFNKRDVASSGVQTGVPHYRANGMQIRCVKAE